MIKVFNETDTTFETNGEVVLNPTYAVVHKEDNGDYYLDLETQLTDETKTIPYEEGSIATINGTGQITADSTKESHLLSIDGETQQDSTTGQQLFNIFDPLTMGDIVSIDNDGWITVTYDNSSGTSTKWFDCKTKTSNLVNTGQSYKLVAEIKSVSGTGTFNLCVDQTMGQVATTQSISLGNATIGTKIYNITMKNSFDGCTTFLNSYGKFEAGQSGSITLRISVVANTSITPETFKYEPYTNGPAPNPTFPMDIHNVSGDNTIEICGKNRLNPSNLYIFNSNKYIATTDYTTKGVIKVQPNTTYSISFEAVRSALSDRKIYSYDKNNVRTQLSLTNTEESNYTLYSFTTLNDTETIGFYIGGGSAYNSVEEFLSAYKLMLINGNTFLPYESYTGQSQLISLGVENLIDFNRTQGTYTGNGTTFEEGKYFINMARDSGVGSNTEVVSYQDGILTIKALYNQGIGYPIKCKPNKSYFVKATGGDSNSRLWLSFFTQDGTFISGSDNTQDLQRTAISPSNAYWIIPIFARYGTSSSNTTFSEIKVIEGNKEQYISNTPIELCKIENQDHTIKYQDRIFFNDPSSPYYNNELQDYKWFLHKEIGKVVFTGAESESWSLNSNSSMFRTTINNMKRRTTTPSSLVISNYFANKNYNDMYNSIVDYGTEVSDSNSDYLYIRNANISTTSDFKTWLTTHNTIVYYVLATPTNTEITNEELLGQLNSIKVINGLNNISVNSPNLIPPIQIQYNHVTGGEVSTNDYIQPNKILVANTPTGNQPFRITNIEKNRRRIRLQAKHLTYDSENYVIEDSYVVDKTCNQALDHLNNATDNTSPFTTTSDITTINSYRCVRKSLWEAINVVLERWGGHLTRNNWQIGIMNSIGQDNGVVVRYAKNLKNIDVQYDWSQVVTKILPVGEDGLLLDEVFLYADIQYDIPYTKVVKFDQNIDDEPYRDEDGVLDEDAYKEALKADLRSQATAYLQEHYIPQVNYELNANLEKITDIGDTIQVKDERLGIDLLTNLISYDYDCILEKYKTLEFGNFRKTISDLTTFINTQTTSIVDDSVSTTRITLQNELETATSQIWGVLGNSYVIIEGDKILIVDSLPKENATNVWMFNNGGLAFSNTGINGTFKQAWTINGTFNTQNINVINFTADLIKGGTLKLGSNVNQNGILEVYDEANNLIALLNKDGLRMNAVNGDYVLINQNVGFAGYDRNDNKIYWADGDEFHMKKSVVEEEITLVDKMRIIPITITNNGTIVNDGIGFVSTI